MAEVYPLYINIFIIKEIKGDVKNQPYEDREKIRAPDGIRTHDPPCSRSDALSSELLRTRWRARVVGSNPIWGSDFFCVLLWLILYISLYFLYNINISGIN